MNPPPSSGVSVEEMQVGKIYAEAIWPIAQAQKLGQELADELDALVESLVGKLPKFAIFMNVGTVTAGERQRVLDKALKGRVSELCYRLICVLNEHDRLGTLRAVARRLRQLAGDARGRIRVEVASAAAVEDGQKEQLHGTLAKKFAADPDISYRVDPALLGGVRIAVGETVFDYSVRANLERLREEILTRSAHEVQSGRNRLDHPEGN